MLKTKLLRGDEVLKLVDTPAFIANWKKLARLTTGFTRLQEPEFVLTWYAWYGDTYEPVVAVVLEGDDTPVALMCLAWEMKSGTLTHAGEKNAEYHGWLAKPALESQFLAETVSLVCQRFQLKKWCWGWIPPGFKSHAFNDLKALGNYVAIEQRASLLWNLGIPEKLQKIKKSRSITSKFKRLQKRGNLRFRIVTSETELEEILTTVAHQCDFRQEAINGIRPFADNPNKIAFNAALLKYPGTIHASGLWLDNKLLAFHFGICDEKRVCLGTSSYDPSESKSSPGTLLMVLLAEALTAQGYEIFDLTPGTDSYKERYANDQQVLYRPSMYFSADSRMVARITFGGLSLLNGVLPRIGSNIHDVKNWWDLWKEGTGRIRHLGFSKTAYRLARGVCRIRKLGVYQCHPSPNDKIRSTAQPMNVQHYVDLMQYHHKDPWPTRRDLLKEGLLKFSMGESLLSGVENKELRWFCWHAISPSTISLSRFSKPIEMEESAHVLYDFYATDKKSFAAYMEQALNTLHGQGSMVHLVLDGFLKIPTGNIGSWEVGLTKHIYCIQMLWVFKFLLTERRKKNLIEA